MSDCLKMPVLFVGHGSPMNAIETNEYSKKWRGLSGKLPKPKAILAISAHWYTEGSLMNAEENPKMIYDMYGFPDELYELTYPVKGSRFFAERVQDLLGSEIKTDNSWGIDHGIWSVLVHLYPKADIPIIEMSVDRTASFEKAFEIGKKLNALRREGVLMIGSGNVVHNLARVNWNMTGGYDWAEAFDGYIKENIQQHRYEDVIHFEKEQTAQLAFYMPDHFYPLLYVLGASEERDKITIFNNSCTLGALSMTSYLFHR